MYTFKWHNICYMFVLKIQYRPIIVFTKHGNSFFCIPSCKTNEFNDYKHLEFFSTQISTSLASTKTCMYFYKIEWNIIMNPDKNKFLWTIFTFFSATLTIYYIIIINSTIYKKTIYLGENNTDINRTLRTEHPIK